MEHSDLKSDHHIITDATLEIERLNGDENDGVNNNNSSLHKDKETQAYHKVHQTGSSCRCSLDPVIQIYTHFKSMQKLHQQRQARIAREERKRHRKTDIARKTFSVDTQSGRWLSLDLNSGQPVSGRMSNTRNIEIEPTNKNKANLQNEKTLSADNIKSPTGFLKSSSEHFVNNLEESNTKSSFQTEDSNRRTNKSKNQIDFNMPESPFGQRKSATTKVHWNNVPPGRVTPANITVITIDRNRLM